jgi:hypothetical protein
LLPDTSLQVALGELKVDNFHNVFNELFPNSDFSMVLPTLVDLATQALGSNNLSFNLNLANTVSGALNGAPIAMRVNDIFRDGQQMDYLTLSLTFYTPGHMLSVQAPTRARLADDPGTLDRSSGSSKPTGRVRIKVGEGLPTELASRLEYQMRVEAGMWHSFESPGADGTIVLEDPLLNLPGERDITVRARYKGDYTTLDPIAQTVTVPLNFMPPLVSALVDGDGVQIRVLGAGRPLDRLSLNARLEGPGSTPGAWFSIPLTVQTDAAVATFPLSQVRGASSLVLVARDDAGNESSPLAVRVENNPAEPAQAAGCVCHGVRGGSESTGVICLLAFGAIFVARRRRR